MDITYIALLADITADNAELTGYSTTTNVRVQLWLVIMVIPPSVPNIIITIIYIGMDIGIYIGVLGI